MVEGIVLPFIFPLVLYDDEYKPRAILYLNPIVVYIETFINASQKRQCELW